VLNLSIAVADAVPPLAAALGCGLLIGIERERRKGTGPARSLAGVRSFALVSVLGAAAMLMNSPWLVGVGAAFVAALVVVAYARDTSGDPGITTEVALLLTYLIGVLCTWSMPLAAGMAMGLTLLLAARERMHHFARHWLRPGELRDGILLGALVLIALPLMPDRAYWGPVLNPHVIAQLLALLLAIQALAHLARRLLQARHAVALSALASGFVSSTAAIATLGMAVRKGHADARAMAGAALLTCVATLLQLLVVAATVQPAWLAMLWAPCLAGALLAALWGGWLVARPAAEQAQDEDAGRDAPKSASAPSPDPAPDTRMFSLRTAAAVAAALTGIQAAVHALGLWLGDAGLLAGTLLAALLELHSAMAAVLLQGTPEAAQAPALLRAVMLGLAVHACAKCVTAWLSGGRRYALVLAPGLLGHTALCVTWLWAVASRA
jgi:uncharacterized membrane protein (DUF4010 family)